MNNQYMYPYFDVWGEADYLSGNTCFNLEKFQRSESGKNLMNARSLMERFEDVDDPALLALWEEMGVRCEVRVTKGRKWLCFVPLEAYGKTEEKYPVLMVFRPVGLLAEAFYQYNIEQSAQGEYITMIYSDEDFDVNDVYFDMLQEVLSDFPADPTRVYTTGHSHYGELAMEFTRRFHQHIAAIAQQGDSAGIILNFYGSATRSAAFSLINGSGRAKLNLAIAIIDGVISRMGFAALLGFALKLDCFGFWMGDALAGFMPLVVGGAFYLSGRWKEKA